MLITIHYQPIHLTLTRYIDVLFEEFQTTIMKVKENGMIVILKTMFQTMFPSETKNTIPDDLNIIIDQVNMKPHNLVKP